MANAFTIDQIVQEFGAFYQKGSQGYHSLFRGLMQIPVTLKLAGINHIKTDDTIWRGANPIVGSFLQPYQEAFTPKGNVDFHPNQIQLRPCKVDVEIFPERIEESWLGFLGGDDSRVVVSESGVTKVWGDEVVGYAFGAETREAMVEFFAAVYHA